MLGNQGSNSAVPSWPPAVTGRLLGLAADLTCVAGFDGHFQELSDSWLDVLGYSCDELLARPFLEFVCPEDVDSTREELAALQSGRDMALFQNRVIAKDGSTRWLLWTAIAAPEERRYYTIARNMTAQREAEERVRESERRYSDLIESSHDLVQSISPDGHFEFVNRAWHDVLGYTPDELPDITLFDILDPADHEHCTAIIGQLMSGASLERIEVDFVAKDGRRIPVEGNATGRFHDGEYVATHAFFRDVSERRKAEELSALYQKELEEEVASRTAALVRSEKLATLGRLSAGMAHELNNPAAASQRGAFRLREAVTDTCASLLSLTTSGVEPADVPALSSLLELGEQRASEPDALDPLTRSDREGEVEDWLDRHGVDDGWEIAGSLVSLGLTVPELEDLEATFGPDRLPIALRAACQAHTAYASLEQISHGTQRISQIVTALKAYSFMDRAPVQRVDIHEGLDNTLVMLQGKLKRGVDVQRRYGDDVPAIEAHGNELNQVWTNLIDNAVDAMGGQGSIAIRTRRSDDSVIVEIEDDGPGIPAEHVEKVFDPFFTTKLPGQGTGLGLNIVYNALHDSGGRIDVRSQPGRTVFTVQLPIERREVVAE